MIKIITTLHGDGIFITKEYIMEQNRFKQLLESSTGNVKPLLTEQDWSKFPCVTGFAGAKQRTLSDGSIGYDISGVTYYNNGRKSSSDGNVTYTCNDPEFKAQGDVAPTGNYVQQAQALIGIPQAEQDGKFGPKTLQALKTKLGVS